MSEYNKVLNELRKIDNKYQANATTTITNLKKEATEINSFIRNILPLNRNGLRRVPIISNITSYRKQSKHNLFNIINRKVKEIKDAFTLETKQLNKTQITLAQEIKDAIHKKEQEYSNILKGTSQSPRLIIQFDLPNGSTQTYTITPKFKEYIEEFIEGMFLDRPDTTGSDSDVYRVLNNYSIDNFKISLVDKYNKPLDGEYFDFINTSRLNLKHLQIYNKLQYTQKLTKGIDNCLIHALTLSGVKEEYINELKLTIQNFETTNAEKSILTGDAVSLSLFKKPKAVRQKQKDGTYKIVKTYKTKKSIPQIINKYVIVKYLEEKNYKNKQGHRWRQKEYGDKDLKGKDEITLYLYKNHYMANLSFKCTRDSIIYYDLLKDKKYSSAPSIISALSRCSHGKRSIALSSAAFDPISIFSLLSKEFLSG